MEVTLHNTTQKLCVIGDPVLHSKSPLIQNTMLRALGLDYIYLCQPVPRGRAGEWLKCAAFAGYAGFNATMPHKEELLPLMDELDGDARMYGAVNTVCIRDGKYYGFNTDGKGFLASLRHAGVNKAGQRVLVLGAGGAAKAVAPKLCQERAAQAVYVANRTAEKARALCAPWGERMIPADFRPETLAELAAQCSLVVNCTNLGMEGTAGQFADFSFLDALPAGAAVCDLIYAPAETELLRQARMRGFTALNGLGMLIWQAVFALEHFTRTPIDGAAMLPLVEEALAQRVEPVRHASQKCRHFFEGMQAAARTSSGQSPHRSPRPDGQGSLRSLAPSLPNKPASLGFVWVPGSHTCVLGSVFSDVHAAGKHDLTLFRRLRTAELCEALAA